MKAKWTTIIAMALTFPASQLLAQSGASSTSLDGSAGAHKASSQQQQQVKHVQFSKLLGSEIKSAQGESLGKVQDLLINPQNGQIRMAIAGTSLAGGQAEMFTPIPWQALNVKSEKDYVLNIDRQKFSTAPSMQKDQYSQLENPDYVVHVFTFYGVEQPEAVGGTAQGSDGQQQGKSSSDQDSLGR